MLLIFAIFLYNYKVLYLYVKIADTPILVVEWSGNL